MIKIRCCLLRICGALTTFVVGLAGFWIFNSNRAADVREPQFIAAKNESLKSNSPDLPVSVESYAVYSAVLTKFADTEQVVISDRTSPIPWDQFMNSPPFRRDFNPGEDLLGDYRAKNAKVFRVENKFTIPSEAFMLGQEEEDALFPRNSAGWDRFHARFPKAREIFYFSNIGFNREKTEAMVHVAHNCRSCDGNFYLLKKTEGKWIVWAGHWSSNVVE